MIICKKCHKAMKSETATEFCKCCYPEPEEGREMSAYDVLAHYNRPRKCSENNEEQIIKLHPHDNSSN